MSTCLTCQVKRSFEQPLVDINTARPCQLCDYRKPRPRNPTLRLPGGNSRTTAPQTFCKSDGAPATVPVGEFSDEAVKISVHGANNDAISVICQDGENVVRLLRKATKMDAMAQALPLPRLKTIAVDSTPLSDDDRDEAAWLALPADLRVEAQAIVDSDHDDASTRRIKLRALRHLNKVTQEEAATIIARGRTTWADWENDQTKQLDASTLRVIAEKFNVTADWLIGRSGWAIHPATKKPLYLAVAQAIIDVKRGSKRGRPTK